MIPDRNNRAIGTDKNKVFFVFSIEIIIPVYSFLLKVILKILPEKPEKKNTIDLWLGYDTEFKNGF